MKNIMTVENIRENWDVAHMNIPGDVVSAATWLQLNHDELIGYLLEQVEILRKQLMFTLAEIDKAGK